MAFVPVAVDEPACPAPGELPLVRQLSVLDLPQDIISDSVFSFLDGRSLAQCEAVCTGFHEVAREPRTWQRALMADFRLSRSQRLLTAARTNNAKTIYRNRCNQAKQRRENEERRRQAAVTNYATEKRAHFLSAVLHYTVYFPQFCVLSFVLPVFLYLLGSKLDDDFDMPWWQVFMPLDIALASLPCTLCVSSFFVAAADCVGHRFHNNERSVWRKLQELFSEEDGFRRAAATCCCLLGLVSLAAVPFLVHYKLDGDLDWTWLATSIPLWGFVLCAMCSSGLIAPVLVFVTFAVFAWLLSGLAATVAWADNDESFALEQALVPYWILDCIIFLGVCGMHVVYQRNEADTWFKRALGVCLLIVALALFSAVFLPQLFLVLKSHDLLTSMSYANVFRGPLILSALVGAGLGLRKLYKYHRKFNRDNNTPRLRDLRGGGAGAFGLHNV